MRERAGILPHILPSLYWGWSVVQSLLFLFFYSFPPEAIKGHDFTTYFQYNGLLVADFVSKIPLMGSSFLILPLKNPRRAARLALMGLILSTGLFLVIGWGMTLGRTRLQVHEAVIKPENLPAALDGMRIIQISDLHAGSFRSPGTGARMKRICNEFQPDLLFFTGDLVNNFSWEVSSEISWLAGLKAQKGKYAIMGNHDYGDYSHWETPQAKAANLEGIKRSYSRLGFLLLLNESEKVAYNGDSLYVTGVENWGNPPFPVYADLQKAGEGIPATAFRILLTHDPAHWDAMRESLQRYPLTFAGHTHGFQWGIKLAGIPFSTAWFRYPRWGGIYHCDSAFLVVNRGTGTIGLHFRIDMPPEITRITLRKR